MSDRRRGSRSRIALAFGAALIAILAYAMIHPVKLGVAEYYAAPAMNFIRVKRSSGEPLTDVEWQQLEAALLRGSELAPGNPDYLAHLGHLQQINISRNRDNLAIEDLVRYSELASSYYGRAAELRPTWTYDWGDLAIEEDRVGKYTNSEFSQFLVRAARFGPWKNDTQVLVAELGADTLEFLSIEAQQAYLRNLDRALRRQPERVIAVLDSHDIWQPVCDLTIAATEFGNTTDLRTENTSMRRDRTELAVLEDRCLQRPVETL